MIVENKFRLNINSAIALSNLSLEELMIKANQIRIEQFGSHFELCSIVNAKSGLCSENCSFCAQSVHFKTQLEEYNFLKVEKIIDLAREMERKGVRRFSLVTSGKSLTNSLLKKLLPVYRELKNNTSLELCASHGILSESHAILLKENGVTRYHHNLETARSYFSNICTTHTYDERVATVKAVKNIGMEVCCGGIMGLGESMEQRIELAFEIQKLEVNSIPLNILDPVKGTPLESVKRLSPQEILKTFALYRIINPTAEIRIAGGRKLLTNHQIEMLNTGINGIMTGNYLTKNGFNVEHDVDLLRSVSVPLRS